SGPLPASPCPSAARGSTAIAPASWRCSAWPSRRRRLRPAGCSTEATARSLRHLLEAAYAHVDEEAPALGVALGAALEPGTGAHLSTLDPLDPRGEGGLGAQRHQLLEADRDLRGDHPMP